MFEGYNAFNHLLFDHIIFNKPFNPHAVLDVLVGELEVEEDLELINRLEGLESPSR